MGDIGQIDSKVESGRLTTVEILADSCFRLHDFLHNSEPVVQRNHHSPVKFVPVQKETANVSTVVS